MHTVAGMFELYEQFLPTKIYSNQCDVQIM